MSLNRRIPRALTGRLFLIWLLALPSCEKSPSDPPVQVLPESCTATGGTVHSGDEVGGVWRAADGPHRLSDTVRTQQLSIEAGSLVCGAAGARLIATSVSAIGTEELPIRFTAEDAGAPWGGIEAQFIGLTHATVEDAAIGVRAIHVALTTTTLRRIQGHAVSLLGPGEVDIMGSVIDSACTVVCAPERVAAAVFIGAHSRLHLENSRITNSGAGGLLVDYLNQVTLLDVRIEDSRGIGLDLRETDSRRVLLEEGRDVRVTGSASYPARLPVSAAVMLLGSAGDVQAWSGNAVDTVLITGVLGADSVTVHPGPVWLIGQGNATAPLRIGTLHLEPGARVHLATSQLGHGLSVGTLVSRGTAEAPVTISGDVSDAHPSFQNYLRLLDPAVDTSRVTHTRFVSVRLRATSTLPLLLDDVIAEQTEVLLFSPGSRLRRVRFVGSHPRADAVVTITAPGVHLSECVVIGSQGDGIAADVADDVAITDCDIAGNAGAGVVNRSAARLLATDNWWGDPAGPFGPAGDGIVGDVEYVPFRSQPVHVNGAAVLDRVTRLRRDMGCSSRRQRASGVCER